MSEGERDFRIRPGKPRSTRAPKAKSFINQVLRAAQKAGHTSGHAGSGKRSSSSGRSTFGHGRISFGRNRLFGSQRRVVLKARIARHKGRAFRAAPVSLVVYLDATIGEPARLLRSTAHAADLLEAKGRFASELLCNYRQDIAQDLSSLLTDRPLLATLVIEAAYGCRETRDMVSDAYCSA